MSSYDSSPASKKAKTAGGDGGGSSNSNLQSLIYTNEDGRTPRLQVLDQLLVPHSKVYIDIANVEMAYTVIKTMQIRGTYVRVCVARWLVCGFAGWLSMFRFDAVQHCIISYR
jgi:hypothetical protein